MHLFPDFHIFSVHHGYIVKAETTKETRVSVMMLSDLFITYADTVLEKKKGKTRVKREEGLSREAWPGQNCI